MRLQTQIPFSAPQCRAAFVWSAVRFVLTSAPTDLTSLNSRAYLRLVSRNGPSVRKRDGSSIRNGVTSLSHAPGSLISAGGVGRHTPGV